jgi:CubicO group peptidase (beta-lactamase class C family)
MAKAPFLPNASPEAVGLSSSRLQQVMDVLGAEVDASRIPGAVFGIARHGKLAFLEATGFRDKQAGEPMGTDAIFRLASMTKPIVSVAAMTLVERGKLFLGDPVSEYLPQFADVKVAVETRDSRTGAATLVLNPASTPMTVQDLLRHTAGMANFGTVRPRARQPVTPLRQQYIDAGIDDPDQTLAERVDKLARLPLAHHPGTVWDYSMAVDVTGRLIEVISGMSLDRFVAENVTGPLGMADTGYHVPEVSWHRIAQPVADPATGKLPDQPDVRHPPKLVSGQGNMVGTAIDYLRFAQMMLNGGVLDDVRVLGVGTVAHMTSDHLGPISRNTETARRLLEPGYGFGLGFAVRLAGGDSPMAGSLGDYWWAGAFRTVFVVDPMRELVAVLMVNETVYPIPRWFQLFRTLLYQTLVQ